jgi:hypothetical protein
MSFVFKGTHVMTDNPEISTVDSAPLDKPVETVAAVENLQYDFDNYLTGELESINRERNSGFIYVKLPDGTEEQFYVTERVLRKANYYLDTKPGTQMRVKLTRDDRKNGAVGIGAIERNPKIPPRPDARTLPWLSAKVTKPRDPTKDFMFLTVTESCELFNAPVDVYVPMRLLRNSGYEEGLPVDKEIGIRVIIGERGLVVVAVRYPEGFNSPGRPLD